MLGLRTLNKSFNEISVSDRVHKEDVYRYLHPGVEFWTLPIANGDHSD